MCPTSVTMPDPSQVSSKSHISVFFFHDPLSWPVKPVQMMDLARFFLSVHLQVHGAGVPSSRFAVNNFHELRRWTRAFAEGLCLCVLLCTFPFYETHAQVRVLLVCCTWRGVCTGDIPHSHAALHITSCWIHWSFYTFLYSWGRLSQKLCTAMPVVAFLLFNASVSQSRKLPKLPQSGGSGHLSSQLVLNKCPITK